jgi:hypothetical protein
VNASARSKDWLVASSPDASTIRTAWGPTVVPVEMEEVVKTLGNHLVLVFGHHLDRLQNWCYGVARHITTS